MDAHGIGQSLGASQPPAQAGERLAFGEFELDPSSGRLWQAGGEVDLDPKPLRMLSHLLSQRERVVSRDELRRVIWHGVAVSDAAIASALRDVRRALGDTGTRQRFIRTVRGEGFRFVADAERRRVRTNEDQLVGRKGLLDRIESALSTKRADGGRWVWLAGEPGVGKTRLLFELERRARARGAGALIGRCLEEEGAAPYRPWQQIIRKLLDGLEDAEVRRRYGDLASEALRLLPERNVTSARSIVSHEGDMERLWLFDAVTDLVRRAACETPTILVFDDLHRADDASVRLLRHLLNDLPRIPLLVVAAYREWEIDDEHPLHAALAASQPGVERISLSGLRPEEVAELASASLGRRVSGEFGRVLWKRTQGNPLFVGEIVRALVANDDREIGSEPEQIEALLPAGVCDAIRARLARLPSAVEELLAQAAVLGREFDLDLLFELRAYSDHSADRESLDLAIEAGLIERSSPAPGRLRFTHILIRDVLYDGIPELRKADLHADAGHTLERLRAATRGEHLEALAHHFSEAAHQGEAQRALAYASEAGQRAMAQSAYAEAARFFSLALRANELASATDTGEAVDATRAQLLVGLGEAHWRAGETELARDAFERAAELARGVGAAETLAAAALGYAGRTDASPTPNATAVALLEQAIAELPEEDSAIRSEALARLGTELYYSSPEACEALTREAVSVAERIGDRNALAYALSASAYSQMRPEVEPAQRMEVCERQIALAGEWSEVTAIGLQEKMICLLEQGDLARFDEFHIRYEQVAEKLRQPFFRWLSSVFRGSRTFLDGNLEETDRIIEKTLALGQSFETPNAFPMFAIQLVYVRREQGRMAELEPALRSILAEQATYTGFRTALPAMAIEQGRRREARDAFELIFARDLDDLPRDQHWIPILAMLTAACAELSDHARARRLYPLLSPFTGRMVVPGHGATCDGAVDHHLARLATTLGDLDLADEHYDAAVTLERRAGARLYCAHSQRRWAAIQWKRGAPHDREHARELIAEATAAYRALGLELQASQAEAVIRG